MKQPTLKENEADTQRHPATKDVPTGNGKVDSNGSQHLTPEATDESDADDVGEKPSKAGNRRKWLLIVGAIALIGGSITGWRWWQFQRIHVSTDNAQLQGHPSPIAPKIDATVQQILVKDGDYVEAGQPLVILEDQDLALKVQQAEAQLAIAQAQLKSASDTIPLTSQTNVTQVQQSQAQLAASQSAASAAQAQIAQAQATIKTNQAKVVQSETAVTKARTDFQRYELLYQQGAIPAQQFDAARAAYDNAQAELAAARQTVAQSRAELQSAQADFQKAQSEVAAARGQVAERQASGQTVVVQRDQQQLAQAQVKQAQAELALARQQIAYTTIKAPISGYVGELTAQVGQKVQANQPLLSLVPLNVDQVYVEANFKETALGKLRIGESADVEVDAYPGETFHATIAGISPATGAQFALIPPDNATGNYNKVVQWVPVRLVFPPNSDPNHKLRPGLSVTVTVDTTSTAATANTAATAKP